MPTRYETTGSGWRDGNVLNSSDLNATMIGAAWGLLIGSNFTGTGMSADNSSAALGSVLIPSGTIFSHINVTVQFNSTITSNSGDVTVGAYVQIGSPLVTVGNVVQTATVNAGNANITGMLHYRYPFTAAEKGTQMVVNCGGSITGDVFNGALSCQNINVYGV